MEFDEGLTQLVNSHRVGVMNEDFQLYLASIFIGLCKYLMYLLTLSVAVVPFASVDE